MPVFKSRWRTPLHQLKMFKVNCALGFHGLLGPDGQLATNAADALTTYVRAFVGAHTGLYCRYPNSLAKKFIKMAEQRGVQMPHWTLYAKSDLSPFSADRGKLRSGRFHFVRDRERPSLNAAQLKALEDWLDTQHPRRLDWSLLIQHLLAGQGNERFLRWVFLEVRPDTPMHYLVLDLDDHAIEELKAPAAPRQRSLSCSAT